MTRAPLSSRSTVNMSFSSLQLRRAIIALCIGAVPTVRILRDCGYRDILVEAPLSVIPEGTFITDLVTHSDMKNNSIVWEMKGGDEIREQQALKLSRLTGRLFRHQLFLPVDPSGGFSWDVTYLVSEDAHQAIESQLQRLGLEHCVISADEDGIGLSQGTLTIEPVNRALQSRISVEIAAVDPAILPFDAESDHMEIAPFLVAALLQTAVDGELRFTLGQITAAAFGTSWAYFSLAPAAQTQIFRKVREILRAAVRQEMSGYLSVVGGSPSSLGDYAFAFDSSSVLRQDGKPRRAFFAALSTLQARYVPTLAAEFEMDLEEPEEAEGGPAEYQPPQP
jgi:hypothetical protein